MSIGYKKLSELIDDEVKHMDMLDNEQKELLSDLCKKLYMMESDSESISAQRLVEDMMGLIGHIADKFKPSEMEAE